MRVVDDEEPMDPIQYLEEVMGIVEDIQEEKSSEIPPKKPKPRRNNKETSVKQLQPENKATPCFIKFTFYLVLLCFLGTSLLIVINYPNGKHAREIQSLIKNPGMSQLKEATIYTIYNLKESCFGGVWRLYYALHELGIALPDISRQVLTSATKYIDKNFQFSWSNMAQVLEVYFSQLVELWHECVRVVHMLCSQAAGYPNTAYRLTTLWLHTIYKQIMELYISSYKEYYPHIEKGFECIAPFTYKIMEFTATAFDSTGVFIKESLEQLQDIIPQVISDLLKSNGNEKAYSEDRFSEKKIMNTDESPLDSNYPSTKVEKSKVVSSAIDNENIAGHSSSVSPPVAENNMKQYQQQNIGIPDR